jgi:hypothetical protein
MPKVYKNRKKHIDPRYFLDETVNRGEEELNKINNNDVTSHVITEQSKLPDAHQGEEGRMHRTLLAQLISDATMLLDMFDDTTDLPEWLEVKITKASDYIHSATSYLAGEKSREQGRLSGDISSEYSSEEQDKIRSSIMGSMAKNPPSTPWSKGR